jgi:hypothetical protein
LFACKVGTSQSWDCVGNSSNIVLGQLGDGIQDHTCKQKQQCVVTQVPSLWTCPEPH